MPPIIDSTKCSGCGLCFEICPTDVFASTGKGKMPAVEFDEECWHCNACALDCPEQAISLRIPLPSLMLYVDSVREDNKC